MPLCATMLPILREKDMQEKIREKRKEEKRKEVIAPKYSLLQAKHFQVSTETEPEPSQHHMALLQLRTKTRVRILTFLRHFS